MWCISRCVVCLASIVFLSQVNNPKAKAKAFAKAKGKSKMCSMFKCYIPHVVVVWIEVI